MFGNVQWWLTWTMSSDYDPNPRSRKKFHLTTYKNFIRKTIRTRSFKGVRKSGQQRDYQPTKRLSWFSSILFVSYTVCVSTSWITKTLVL